MPVSVSTCHCAHAGVNYCKLGFHLLSNMVRAPHSTACTDLITSANKAVQRLRHSPCNALPADAPRTNLTVCLQRARCSSKLLSYCRDTYNVASLLYFVIIVIVATYVLVNLFLAVLKLKFAAASRNMHAVLEEAKEQANVRLSACLFLCHSP
jgi:hypothetical protein